ncbi:hypothetical protein KFL_000700240 [Klebsormidium nitens]|uniref:Uncharacterized protein n=1 Tax=Klebsormidium nitens TaxID=105231 RepID=A0A1Y1HX24_KLENI|nr:hypothetical protein KFL_000700240 [Klebsormidium nitens]|eukprot:GAQ81087.1 hypothetical protein KFL_000700240 [Klebsormidium nitens]
MQMSEEPFQAFRCLYQKAAEVVLVTSAEVSYIEAAHQKKHLDVLVASLGPAVLPTEGYKQPAREATLHVTSRDVIRYLIGEEKCLELGVLDREEDDDTPEMYGFVLLNQEKGAVKRKRTHPTLAEMATALEASKYDSVANKKRCEDVANTAERIMREYQTDVSEYNRLAKKINESVIAQFAERSVRLKAALQSGFPFAPLSINGPPLRDQGDEFRRTRTLSPEPDFRRGRTLSPERAAGFDVRAEVARAPPPRDARPRFRSASPVAAPVRRPPPGSAEERICTLWVGNISRHMSSEDDVARFCRFLGLAVADVKLLKKRPGEIDDGTSAGFVTLESADAVFDALTLFARERERFRGMLIRPRIPEAFTARGWVPGPGQFAHSNRSVADGFRLENGQNSTGKKEGETKGKVQFAMDKKEESANGRTAAILQPKEGAKERTSKGILKKKQERPVSEDSDGKENVPKTKRSVSGNGSERNEGETRKRKERPDDFPEKERAPFKKLRPASRSPDKKSGTKTPPKKLKRTEKPLTVKDVQADVQRKLADNDFMREWIPRSKEDARFAEYVVWIGGDGVQDWESEAAAVKFFGRLPRAGGERGFAVAMALCLGGKVLPSGTRTKKSFLVEMRSRRERKEVLQLNEDKHHLFVGMSMKAHQAGKKVVQINTKT